MERPVGCHRCQKRRPRGSSLLKPRGCFRESRSCCASRIKFCGAICADGCGYVSPAFEKNRKTADETERCRGVGEYVCPHANDCLGIRAQFTDECHWAASECQLESEIAEA